MKLLITMMIITMVIVLSEYSDSNNYIKKDFRAVNVLKFAPPGIQVTTYLKLYAKQYAIPESIALALAREETGLRSPLDPDYRADQTSNAGAVGATQVMPSTASYIAGKHIDKDELKNNNELNISLSMKYLRYLKDRFHTWDKALGYYHSGRPVVDNYAIRILNS